MRSNTSIINKINNKINPYKGLSKEIYVLSVARIINAAGAFVFPLLTLILTKKLNMDKSQAGMLISGSGLLFMLSSVIGGKLTDSFGRKKLLVLFQTIGASFYILAAFMGISNKIIPVIIMAGFTFGLADPASNALIADITTPENRDKAYSLFYMTMNIGFAVSPLIGGFLFEKYLRYLFAADAITAFIAIFLIYKFIPETINKTKEQLSEERKLEQSVEGSVFKVLLERPILIFYSLVMFGYSFVYSQWGFLYPMHAEAIIPNQGAKFYGTLVSFNALIVITLTPIITKLYSGKKNIRRIFFGGLFYAVGFGMPGFISAIPFMYISTLIITLGEIIVTISSMPFIANHTPASHRGRMSAVLPMIIGFGYTLGPAIMGTILKYLTIEDGWKVISGVMIIFSVFTILLERYDNKHQVKRKVNEEKLFILE